MKILVLPGIGDIYWTLTALRSFLKGKRAEVWIWDIDGRRRSLDFLKMVPWIDVGGYFSHPPTDAFNEVYFRRARAVIPDVLGFDYLIAPNGVLRGGGTLQEAFPDCEIDWFPEMVLPSPQTGDYVVACFSANGMLNQWTAAWSKPGVADCIRVVREHFGCPVYLTGCEWDRPLNDWLASETGAENLVGESNTEAFFSLLMGARACVGWCGGNTIMSTVFGVPTLMGWSGYFPDERFYTNACPPVDNYHPVIVERVGGRDAAKRFCDLH